MGISRRYDGVYQAVHAAKVLSMIGGNIIGTIQLKTYEKDALGMIDGAWSDAASVSGWLDLMGGTTEHEKRNARTQESTHIFLCDYVPLERYTGDVRMVIEGDEYAVELVDDPMHMHKHLEIYLKYVGVML